jgi:excisionase family DNA binding protein
VTTAVRARRNLSPSRLFVRGAGLYHAKSMGKKAAAAEEEALITLPELATYLHLDEKTVFKLVSTGKLPGHTVDGKWRFRRKQIDAWLEEQLVGDDTDFADIPDGMKLPLEDLLPDQAIIQDLKSTMPLQVIEELAGRAFSNGWLTDKPWFVGAIVERESLSSTAMEGGVAFLHTRAKDKGKIARPFLVVGRSWKGLPFGAPDGGQTFLFFLMGLKYDRLHLPILGRLARALRNPQTIAKLRSLSSPQQMRALLLKEDEQARAGLTPQFEPGAFKPKLDRQLRLRTLKRLTAMRNKPDEPVKKGSKGPKAPKVPKTPKAAAAAPVAPAAKAPAKKPKPKP